MTTENTNENTTAPEESQASEQAIDNTQEQNVPPQEGEAKAEETKESQTKEEAKNGFFERQKREKEKLQRENEYLRKLAYQQTQTQQVQQPKQSQYNQELGLEDFQTEDDWFEYKLNQREMQRQQQNEINNLKGGYEQKLTDYSKLNKEIYEYEDYVSKIVSPNVARAIMQSDKAPQIVESLALDPEKARDLNCAQSEYDLARKMVALEGSIDEKPRFSNAPPPQSTPKSDPVKSGSINMANLSKAEYRKLRNEQRKI